MRSMITRSVGSQRTPTARSKARFSGDPPLAKASAFVQRDLHAGETDVAGTAVDQNAFTGRDRSASVAGPCIGHM